MSAAPSRELAWRLFASNVAARLEAKKQKYGDRSFSREPLELVREIEEELLDVSGWAFILWSRIHDLRAAVESLKVQAANDSGAAE